MPRCDLSGGTWQRREVRVSGWGRGSYGRIVRLSQVGSGDSGCTQNRSQVKPEIVVEGAQLGGRGQRTANPDLLTRGMDAVLDETAGVRIWHDE